MFAFTVSFFSIFPLDKILIPDFSLRIIPVSTKSSGVTSVPSSKRFKTSKFTIANSLRLIFVNPRFGIRRKSGSCPPSKPKRTPPPERAFCPL
ncbi:conserved hypothetical protein [Listeria monocytogenes FSL F2-208]|nr:conserved hypothetical protein [Listeria monocytogenes FSL F2-208]